MENEHQLLLPEVRRGCGEQGDGDSNRFVTLLSESGDQGSEIMAQGPESQLNHLTLTLNPPTSHIINIKSTQTRNN